MNWNEKSHFAGLDWASDHHDLVVLDRSGQVIETLRFSHNREGWEQMGELAKRYPGLAVAVETSQGIVIDQLFALGVEIYPVNPKSAERFRERHAPSGVKDDAKDAWSLADALRVDGQGWRMLKPLDPMVAELRQLCRDEEGLIEQRTALILQLKAALREYYPAALEAFDDWGSPGAWAFVEKFPTPAALEKAGRRRWERFLHTTRLWRSEELTQKRLAIFAQAALFAGSAPTTAAKSLLAVSLTRLLRSLEKQLAEYRERIEQLFQRHPDHDLFGSLPGAGSKLAPRLLAEIGDDRDVFPKAENLQCYAGTSPITRQSGKWRYQQCRYLCNDHLRATLHLLANLSRQSCAWAEAYYQQHRENGQSHACALRCLGQRWLKILWAMWKNRTCYDEGLHTRNQIAHGSWVLALTPKKT